MRHRVMILLAILMTTLSACAGTVDGSAAADLNCTEPTNRLPRDQLVAIALEAVKKREPNQQPGEVGVQWSKESCAWYVVVQLAPPGPGRHRDLLIGNDGRIIFYLEGR